MDDKLFGRSGHLKNHNKLPAIMTPVNTISNHSDFGLPDVTITSQFTSLKLTPDYNDSDEESDDYSHSFLLLDEKERLKVPNVETFVKRLYGYKNNSPVKVISIFGNTGDGKSHTLNQCFFKGSEVFRTSSEQKACTVGIWVAFDPTLNIVCLDTEGFSGSALHNKQRIRLLLKVLAVSDIVIYKVKGERLQDDMFNFLGSASKAYIKHFQKALKSVNYHSSDPVKSSDLTQGPSLCIFHETRNTEPLISCNGKNASEQIYERFHELQLNIDGFASLRYIGIQTIVPPTDFGPIREVLNEELLINSNRPQRSPHVVYLTLKALNDKFTGVIKNSIEPLFPDQHLTCPTICQSCEQRCANSVGHLKDNIPHFSNSKCRFQSQFENSIYICKVCKDNGNAIEVTTKYINENQNSWLKYAFSEYIIECPKCGIIYRSKQYWYGNDNPEKTAVYSETRHIWPGMDLPSSSSMNPARKVLDGVTYLSETVASVGYEPSRLLSSWVADQFAPKYWKPNSEIKECIICKLQFSSTSVKHHCRACGEGVCDECSKHSMCVPDRGWDTPVRVCNFCYKRSGSISSNCSESSSRGEENVVSARKFSEALVNTLSSVASVLEYPKNLIKDTAKPSYWIPDNEALDCVVCKSLFGPVLILHHCRECGNGVCENCSNHRKPVPHRGWPNPVRVCDLCVNKDI
ncbi:zinc finger FYVE domain-containing protein 1-like [Daktulosphaira vitifoliae]|uniref:zinc finger FYVE domain-containing protein 1-like n=1 Tax=Daktulosphaira vitifoliae TaxID=58002 RepID=UPI0021AA165A|nr:zinc finger FYVE domain-containing protein 1-like [Daktulosphaira vitifoliae]